MAQRERTVLTALPKCLISIPSIYMVGQNELQWDLRTSSDIHDNSACMYTKHMNRSFFKYIYMFTWLELHVYYILYIFFYWLVWWLAHIMKPRIWSCIVLTNYMHHEIMVMKPCYNVSPKSSRKEKSLLLLQLAANFKLFIGTPILFLNIMNPIWNVNCRWELNVF